jgi:hypothetical protein
MRRKIAIVLLSLGTVVGYASGFCSLRAHHRMRQQAFEQRVARVCVDAAQHGRMPAAAHPWVPNW